MEHLIKSGEPTFKQNFDFWKLLLVPNNVARSKIPWLMQKMMKSNNAMDGDGPLNGENWMNDDKLKWNHSKIGGHTHSVWFISMFLYQEVGWLHHPI